ncbi:hypothetical protein MCAMS1_02295 [biofilm metagenome]
MRLFLLMMLYLSSQATMAVDCGKAITTPDINECASVEQEKVEVQLNAAYKKIIQKLDHPEPDFAEHYAVIKKDLVDAQRAWVKFREADCTAVYTLYRDGTIRNVMYIGCMQSRAEQRMKELKGFDLSD